MSEVGISHLLEKGLARHQAGRFDEARQFYEQVLERQPDNFDALNLLGAVAQNTGDNAGAETTLRKALSIRPEDPDAQYNLGIALMGQGRVEEAIAAYESSLRIAPDSTDALHNL